MQKYSWGKSFRKEVDFFKNILFSINILGSTQNIGFRYDILFDFINTLV